MAKFEGTVAEHIADVFDFNSAGPIATERQPATPRAVTANMASLAKSSQILLLCSTTRLRTPLRVILITDSGCKTFSSCKRLSSSAGVGRPEGRPTPDRLHPS